MTTLTANAANELRFAVLYCTTANALLKKERFAVSGAVSKHDALQ
jgi:hypothetical protein